VHRIGRNLFPASLFVCFCPRLVPYPSRLWKSAISQNLIYVSHLLKLSTTGPYSLTTMCKRNSQHVNTAHVSSQLCCQTEENSLLVQLHSFLSLMSKAMLWAVAFTENSLPVGALVSVLPNQAFVQKTFMDGVTVDWFCYLE